MKRILSIGILMAVLSLLLSLLDTTQPFLSMLKCILLALGITTIGYALCNSHIHKSCLPLYAIGVILLCCYVFIALDTYLFHVLMWFPGILRYALFSTYGYWYVLFLIPGVLLCFHEQNKKSV